MQNKKVVRLTESDIMRMIQNTVSKMLVREDWRDSYDKWADGKGDNEDDKKWGEEIKKEYPNADDRRKAFSQHSKERDKKAGKTKDKRYWRDYDKDMNESISRAINSSINKLMNEGSLK